MTIYCIYKATNTVTNKVYIGFTKNFHKRKIQHKSCSLTNKNNKFYNAINKYGFDSFVWEIIYQSKDKDHTLSTMEHFFILEYNSVVDGYNTGDGGTSNALPGELNGMYGKTHTDKVKEKLRKQATLKFKGKTYEDLYGKDKADQLKDIRRRNFKLVDKLGKNNPRYDPTLYTFLNTKTNQTVVMDRLTFNKEIGIIRSGICDMINKSITYKGWKVIG